MRRKKRKKMWLLIFLGVIAAMFLKKKVVRDNDLAEEMK